eukprot:Gb_21959 [translate_table: standard]
MGKLDEFDSTEDIDKKGNTAEYVAVESLWSSAKENYCGKLGNWIGLARRECCIQVTGEKAKSPLQWRPKPLRLPPVWFIFHIYAAQLDCNSSSLEAYAFPPFWLTAML